MATPVRKIKNEIELTDPNNARVVLDKNKDALYFTRAVIPFDRNEIPAGDAIARGIYYKHIGIYAYRKDFLLKITQLPVGNLEQIEKLEQLRVLEHGYKIRTIETDYHSLSVDTEEELLSINNYIRDNNISMDDDDERM